MGKESAPGASISGSSETGTAEQETSTAFLRDHQAIVDAVIWIATTEKFYRKSRSVTLNHLYGSSHTLGRESFTDSLGEYLPDDTERGDALQDLWGYTLRNGLSVEETSTLIEEAGKQLDEVQSTVSE